MVLLQHKVFNFLYLMELAWKMKTRLTMNLKNHLVVKINCITQCSSLINSFNGLGSMTILTSPFYLLTTTIEWTQSVGSSISLKLKKNNVIILGKKYLACKNNFVFNILCFTYTIKNWIIFFQNIFKTIIYNRWMNFLFIHNIEFNSAFWTQNWLIRVRS